MGPGELAILWSWAELAARWLHIITAIAWIGSSFYFIALDLGLWRDRKVPKGVFGEEWQVHGGGFYHIQKYNVAPAHMPDHLVWFKWESYATWMSGFALLCLLYYGSADFYLIDPSVADLSRWQAIGISSASLVLGWFVYNTVCKSKLGDDNRVLMIVLYCFLVALSWGFTQIFSGRAALLHLGAITGTIMAANVFLVIIPNQRIVVTDLIAGRKPDAKFGKIAKQRSTHNNYLTLPVIFLMMSNHYPLSFATHYNWVIASLVVLMGVTIRHYFNTRHARAGNPHWTWAATSILFFIIMWLSVVGGPERQETLSQSGTVYQNDVHFPQVEQIVSDHCSFCHTAEPVVEGLAFAPKNIKLDNAIRIANAAEAIYHQAGITVAMPPRKFTQLSAQQRAIIRAWYEGAGN